MKPSKFNYFLQIDDKTILAYNSFTSALVELSEHEYKYFQDFYVREKEHLPKKQNKIELRNQLIEMGMIVPKKLNELNQIRELRTKLKQNNQHIGFTIVPTLNCNFKCNYCFSYTKKKQMGSDIQKELLRFGEKKIANAKSLSLAWFGGEPTLCLDIVEKLTNEFRSLCEKYDVDFQAGSMITNGFLLNTNVAKRLKDAGINKVQITLDGDKDIHDGRRRLRNGRGTFDRILENVIETCDLLDLQIRVNIDRKNAQNALNAIESLESNGLKRKVALYFGHVKPFSEACADVAANCLSGKEFSELSLNCTKEALVRGFRSFNYPDPLVGGVCGAESQNSYVVSPEGLIFKCWAEVSMGISHSVGNIFNENRTKQQNQNLLNYLKWDPVEKESCSECKILPICMGGCPYLRIQNAENIDCSIWRYSLFETLAVQYKINQTHRLLES